MTWQPAAEDLIERLAGPALTEADLADCLTLASAVLAALTRRATGANLLLLDAAGWDVDAARAHLAEDAAGPWAGSATPLDITPSAVSDALRLCRRMLAAAAATIRDQTGQPARQALASAARYLAQIAG